MTVQQFLEASVFGLDGTTVTEIKYHFHDFVTNEVSATVGVLNFNPNPQHTWGEWMIVYTNQGHQIPIEKHQHNAQLALAFDNLAQHIQREAQRAFGQRVPVTLDMQVAP